MKKVSKFNAALALGSLTATVALLAGAPGAMAQSDTSVAGQAAPGGGSFPGSFLVPGTNTSLKIGGFAKGVLIYDMSAAPNNGAYGTSPADAPDVIGFTSIPLEGTAAHALHGAVREHARQSNVNVDVRTPTAWGELDTFILIDFFGRENLQTSQNSFQSGSNPDTARLVLAYGTLGPIMAGQNFSLWYDGDAMPETVDPTPTIGLMNGSSNRQPQFRYTYAGANGISAAVSIENPQTEGFAAVGAPSATTGVTTAATTFNSASLGGIDRLPDFLERLRIDQAWGHAGLTAIERDLRVTAPNFARVDQTGWGIQASGHINTFGKDAFKLVGSYGQGLGHYLTDMGAAAGLEVNSLANGAATVIALSKTYAVSAAYTHWWTTELRSTLYAGYDRLMDSSSVVTTTTIGNALEKRHIAAVGNLIWSPVPQVDLGVEYDFGQRVTQLATAGNNNKGYLNRIETEAVFKF